MLKRIYVFVISMLVIFQITPNIVAAESLNQSNKDKEYSIALQKFEKKINNDMPGADPEDLVAINERYLVVETTSGILLIEVNTLQPVGVILADDISLVTQGDGVFSYFLEEDTLYLKRVNGGKSYVYSIQENQLKEAKGKYMPKGETSSYESVSLEHVKDLVKKKDSVSAYEYNNKIVILDRDLNSPGLSKVIVTDKEKKQMLQSDMNSLLRGQDYKKMALLVDGNPIMGKLVLEDGEILVPLRSVLEAKRYKVDWDGYDRSILMSGDSYQGKIEIDKNKLITNGESHELMFPITIKDGRTYIGIDFFREELDFGSSVDYTIGSIEFH